MNEEEGIETREEFFEVLARTLEETERRMSELPGFDPLDLIRYQLLSIRGWTAGGREPTEEERRSVNIGLVAVRELATNFEAPEWLDYMDRLHALDYYVSHWGER